MWYSAKLLYQSIHYRNNKRIKITRPLYEEAIVVIDSKSESHAKKKVLDYAKKSKTEYLNSQNEKVKWELLQIIEIQEIGDIIEDGVEISSRFFKNISSFKRFDPLVKRELK